MYKSTHSLWAKKHWITACGVLGGVALVIVGRVDPQYEPTMFGLAALCAIFLEAGNGANFALVPHVHPFANGIVSGLTGAAGNLGGILFSIVFRFVTHANAVSHGLPIADYACAFWIIGVVHIGVYVAVSWIPPIPKNQVGGIDRQKLILWQYFGSALCWIPYILHISICILCSYYWLGACPLLYRSIRRT